MHPGRGQMLTMVVLLVQQCGVVAVWWRMPAGKWDKDGVAAMRMRWWGSVGGGGIYKHWCVEPF